MKRIERIKKWLYEFRHGHPFLLEEEVEIICKTRAEQKYKHFNDRQIQKLIQIRIDEMYKTYKEQQKCSHKKWNCDNQIRTIECIECGKRAWIEDYRNIYSPKS